MRDWAAVWQIYSSVREMALPERQSFLDSSGTDPEILRQVVLLLEQSEAQSFALSESTPLPIPGHRQSRREHWFGKFEITGSLGRGGMGEVFAALDTELGRNVALKFLTLNTTPGSKAGDRLLREAQTASALNHPNIVTIYEVIRSESSVAIVMELVEGCSAREFCKQPVSIDEAVSIGRQIAQALVAAHAQGIVHRDIKPENIMVRPDGAVKVLDFGLARQVAKPSGNFSDLLPQGTLRYMSPEQVRCEPASAASDVFSFGLVLHELLTGHHPFAADNPVQTACRIMVESPGGLPKQVPEGLQRLIQSMLAKDSSQRPSAGQVARALEQTNSPVKTARFRIWFTTLAAAFLAVALLAWFAVRKNDSPDFSDLRIQPLTSQWGWEGSPALSPDGKSVAFTWSDKFDSPEQIYLKQRDLEHLTQLTAFKTHDRIGSLVWSPDGKRIAFKRSLQPYEHPGVIYLISREGGNEQKLLELSNGNLSSSIDWSPDGTELAYSDASAYDQLAIYLFNLQTGRKQKLTSPPGEIPGDWDPKFSPDGKEVAFKRVRGHWADDIYVTKTIGGPIRRATAGVGGIWGHAWTANGKNLIVSCQCGNSVHGLWRFPLTGTDRTPQRLLQGVADAITPATNRKTNVIAFVNQFQDLNIYRVSLKGNSQPEKLIASTLSETQGAYSTASRIAFVSDRSGSREIWMSDSNGVMQTRLTNFNSSLVDDPQWSHDGRRLACKARSNSIDSVFTLNCNPKDMHCDAPRQLPSSGSAQAPSWSADDRFLYFASERTGRSEIYKQLIEGGPHIQVTHNGGYMSRESADGRWLYFSKPQMEGVWRMAVAASAGKSVSAEELVIGPPYRPTRDSWTLAGGEIIFIDQSVNSEPAIRAYNIVTRRARLILSRTPSFFEKNDTRISVSPDLQWVLYSQVDELRSNVMLAENPK